MTARVLIVDDERNLRRMLRSLLEDESYNVAEAEGVNTALDVYPRFDPDVILVDLVMEPGPNGLHMLEQLNASQTDAVVVMMSGKATLEDAVKATKLGAFQFLEKPLSPEMVLSTVRAAVELSQARNDNRALRADLPASHEIVGDSDEMARVRALVAQVAATPSRVLISGESGTGKELVARAIHRHSTRHARPMVCINCAAVPMELLESEMFGHERGAFTGAVARRRGKFELAHQSTLFLDEVGDMHLEAQAKLLRVLETGTIERVGGEQEKDVDVRVVAATNKDLDNEISLGRFREDLYYRLNVFPIVVPPLRDRLVDLPVLVEHFANLAGGRCARAPRRFTEAALEQLAAYDWPGNVRELANVVERLTIAGSNQPVSPAEVRTVLPYASHGSGNQKPRAASGGLSAALEEYEKQLIRTALNESRGNVTEAARRLATDRANLHRRMRRLGLSRNDTNVSE